MSIADSGTLRTFLCRKPQEQNKFVAFVLCCKTATCLRKCRGWASGPDSGSSIHVVLPNPGSLMGQKMGLLKRAQLWASVIASQASSRSCRGSEVMPVFSGHQLPLQHWDNHFTEHRPGSRIPFWFGIQPVGETALHLVEAILWRWLQERGLCKRGKIRRLNSRPGRGGIWGTVSALSVKGLFRVGPQVLFLLLLLFSFFY